MRSPPALPAATTGGGATQVIVYLPMLAGAGATAVLVAGTGASPVSCLAGAMMGLSMLGMLVTGAGRAGREQRRRLDRARRDYLCHLEQVRRRARSAAAQQRAAATFRHPDPDALGCLAAGTRLWERRPGDDDFLLVRVGRGPQPASVPIAPGTGQGEDLEPVSADAVRRLVRAHTSVPDLPIAFDLAATGRIVLAGDPRHTRALARSVVAQLATFHAPGDVLVAVCTDAARVAHWEWVKWLPHALSPDERDAAGRVRLVADDLAALDGVLRGRLTGTDGEGTAHVVVIVDGGRASDPAQLAAVPGRGVTVLDLSPADADDDAGAVRFEVGEGSLVLVPPGAERADGHPACVPDRMSVVQAESLARCLSRWRPAPEATDPRRGGGATLTDLLDLGDPRVLDPQLWRQRRPGGLLRVPIGLDPAGNVVELDLRESAQGGMGPHGLVVGATGSGKSELLRTLVLGLALTHSSQELNLVLVDFKGGATFAGLGALPHTSAVITNLEDELVLVDRMREAVAGELVRRQEALRAGGNHASVRDYEHAREHGAPLDPMPSLLIVVDEFSELLSARPDLLELFVTIGRLGRSLGVHLLLASQRLEEGRLRGLDTQLSYRIGLRTFSAAESRTVLGVPDAYELPPTPGHGYLKDGSAGPTRFRAAYASGAVPVAQAAVAQPATGPAAGADAVRRRVVPYGLERASGADAAQPSRTPSAPPARAADPSLLEVVVSRLAGTGVPARRIWLPPLDEPSTLGELLGPLVPTDRGLQPCAPDADGPLTATIGLLDRPFDQRRDPHRVDLSGAHVAVAGRPQSGKSTLLRTLIASLALTATPEQVQIYCLDFGGGTLSSLAGLPHVGSVATGREPERLRRTVAELEAVLEAREERFARHGVDSMAAYRRLVARGAVPRDGFGDVVVVVDGWGTLREEHESLETALTRIAARGLGHGVHLVVSVQRWTQLRPALRDLIAGRLELRLGDPSDSQIDRRAAAEVPEDAAGRGLSPQKLHLLAALPRIDGRRTVDDLAAGVADLVARVRAGWSGPVAPPVRLLPRVLHRDQLAAPPGRAAVAIGLAEDDLGPVHVDFDAEPHLLVLGDAGSGKSNLLRTVARGITERWTPHEAGIVTVDYRRGLLGAVPPAHHLAGVRNTRDAASALADAVEALRERVARLDGESAGDRIHTWTGPRLFLLVDDYELVAAGGNPMQALLDFLPLAREIGLHVVLGRGAGGAGQAMFEPVLRTLRDVGTPALLLSGSQDEGAVLGGRRMEPLPPGRARLVRRHGRAILVQTALAGHED